MCCSYCYGEIIYRIHVLNSVCCISVRYVFEDRERNMCVFSRRFQRHTTTTSFFNAHFHTHTHTHTHDGPTRDARSSGSRFFGFNKKYFDPKRGSQEFFGRQGVTYIRKRLQTCNCFQLFMFIFFFNAGIMLRMYSIIRI